jgi:hypothetical protein
MDTIPVQSTKPTTFDRFGALQMGFTGFVAGSSASRAVTVGSLQKDIP